MYFNISDIKTYNIDESYKQCFSNIKNSVEYSLTIDYMLERFDKNIVKEICLFLYKFKFATKKQIINVIGKKYNISIDFNFQELVDFDFFKDFILVKGFVDEEYERNEEIGEELKQAGFEINKEARNLMSFYTKLSTGGT